jgi:hypothetical protein
VTITQTPDKTRPSRDRLALLVFAISFVAFVLFTDHLIEEVRWPTGDEPYYLLMAHSLIHDHDLELTNNFEAADYFHYYPGDLIPYHESITTRPGLWSKHSPGVAVLVAPGYAWLDWRGATLTINFLAALLAANIYLLGKEAAGRRWVGVFTWLALSFTNPLASFAPLIFPAIPAALFTVYAFRQIRNGRVPADAWRTAFTALCIGGLPWLNPQLIPVAAGLFVYAVASVRPQGLPVIPGEGPAARLAHWFHAWVPNGRGLIGSLAPFLGPLVVLGIAYTAYNYFLYTSIFPNWQDHAGSSDLAGTVGGLFGTLLDQQWGLLIHAPLLLLAFSGLLVMARRCRHDLAWLAIIGLPYFLLIISYKEWWGEWCPPARYMAPLIPLLALPMAQAVGALRRWPFLIVYAELAAISYGIMGAFAATPLLMYNHPVGRGNLLLKLAADGGPDLTTVIPTFFVTSEASRTALLTAVWAVNLAVIVWWGYRCAERENTGSVGD